MGREFHRQIDGKNYNIYQISEGVRCLGEIFKIVKYKGSIESLLELYLYAQEHSYPIDFANSASDLKYKIEDIDPEDNLLDVSIKFNASREITEFFVIQGIIPHISYIHDLSNENGNYLLNCIFTNILEYGVAFQETKDIIATKLDIDKHFLTHIADLCHMREECYDWFHNENKFLAERLFISVLQILSLSDIELMLFVSNISVGRIIELTGCDFNGITLPLENLMVSLVDADNITLAGMYHTSAAIQYFTHLYHHDLFCGDSSTIYHDYN